MEVRSGDRGEGARVGAPVGGSPRGGCCIPRDTIPGKPVPLPGGPPLPPPGRGNPYPLDRVGPGRGPGGGSGGYRDPMDESPVREALLPYGPGTLAQSLGPPSRLPASRGLYPGEWAAPGRGPGGRWGQPGSWVPFPPPPPVLARHLLPPPPRGREPGGIPRGWRGAGPQPGAGSLSITGDNVDIVSYLLPPRALPGTPSPPPPGGTAALPLDRSPVPGGAGGGWAAPG